MHCMSCTSKAALTISKGDCPPKKNNSTNFETLVHQEAKEEVVRRYRATKSAEAGGWGGWMSQENVGL